VLFGELIRRNPSSSLSRKQVSPPLQSSSTWSPVTSALPGKRLALLSSQSVVRSVEVASWVSTQSWSADAKVDVAFGRNVSSSLSRKQVSPPLQSSSV